MAAKEAFAQVVGFEQAAEFQERRGAGHAFGGQARPLLEEIDAQHALQPDGRTSAFALGMERLDDGQQFRPRNDGLQAGEEFLAAGGSCQRV